MYSSCIPVIIVLHVNTFFLTLPYVLRLLYLDTEYNYIILNVAMLIHGSNATWHPFCFISFSVTNPTVMNIMDADAPITTE